MKNIHEKYGRKKEFPALLESVPVVGWLKIHNEVHSAQPHYFPHYQLIAILEGHANFWSKDRIYSLNPGEMILFKPYQIVGTLGNTMPKTERCFIQFDTSSFNKLKYVKPNVSIDDFASSLNNLEVMSSGQVPSIIKKIITEHRNPSDESELLCEIYLIELMIEIKRIHSQEAPSENRGIQKLVDDYIDENISLKIDTSSLAKICDYSSSYFRNILQEITSMSPNKYIQHRRYLKACELLEKTDMSIFEIAMETGFSSSQYFATTFKSITSMSPQEFREFYKNVLSSEIVSLETNKAVEERNSQSFISGIWY